jgi:nicotinate (nicotinamide) nucleotide adenylyltransferase
MARIGIFGGTFDPFTCGHAAVVVNAFKQCDLDRIIIVPTTVNYYRSDKRYLFTFDEKVEIINDFITGVDYPVSVDTVEKDKDGSWRTIDLIQYFKEKFKGDDLYLIIGEDSYKEFKTWTRWEDILKEVTLAVANRASGNEYGNWRSSVPAVAINMGNEFEDCSATNTRNKLISEIKDLYLSDKEWYNGVDVCSTGKVSLS